MSRTKLAAIVSLLCLSVSISVQAAPPVTKERTPRPLPAFRASNGRTYRLGGLPTPKRLIERSRRLAMTKAPRALPASVDLSAQMPPVGDQGQQGSCTAWSTTYYCKTFHEAKEQGWSAATSDHQYSPAWTYNQINWGWDSGSWPYDAFELLRTKGATTLAEQPYSAPDYRTWPTLNQYLAAMPDRIQDYVYLFWGAGSGGAAIDAMKATLAAGYPVVVVFPIYSDFDPQPPHYVYDGVAGGAEYEGGHAVCIVGYDDDIGGIGGFQFRNSWGSDWGNAGSAYLSYGFVSDWADEAWSMTDRIGYVPQAWAKILINHTWRGDLVLDMGHGSESSSDWSVIVYANQGGSSNDINTYVDVTDVGTVVGDWWVRASDEAGGDTGTLHTFSLIKGSTEIISAETPQGISDYATVVAHLAWTLEQYVLRAVTASGGTHLSAQNHITVHYTSGGDPATAKLWDGHDATIQADGGNILFATTSSASGANERWTLPAVTASKVSAATKARIITRTYYNQLLKLFATTTASTPLLGAGNSVGVTYRNCGAEATTDAYDGLTSTAAVWADRGTSFSYAATSSASNARERWAAPEPFTGTINNNQTVSPHFWHQYKPTVTLNGTDATYVTQLLERSLFGEQALASGLHTQWSDWADAAGALAIRHYTTGEPRRSTADPTEWQVDSAFFATCDFQPYFAIQGIVHDGQHNPLEGVTVRVGDIVRATNAHGYYQVRDLDAGTYTITPSKVGWSFSPTSRTATVNDATGNAEGQSFAGFEVPTVTAWTPRGTGVLPTQEITLTFSRPMNEDATEAAFHLSEVYAAGVNPASSYAVGGACEWNGDHTVMTFHPERRLGAYRSYHVHLDDTARSAQNARPENAFEWSFQTVDGLTVTNWTPRTQHTALGAVVTLEFDRDVAKNSVREAFSIAPAVPGAITFPTGRSMVFTPSSPLQLDTQYLVTLAGTARGLDAVPLRRAFTWPFTAAGPATVLSSTPRGRGVPLRTSVVVTFDQTMDRATTQHAFSLYPVGGAPLPGSFAWNEDLNIMTFVPTHWLRAHTTYVIRVADTATSRRGSPLAETYLSEFRTADVLQVLEYGPHGTAANLSAPIRILFDRPVNPATFNATTLPAIGGDWTWESDSSVKLVPDPALSLNTEYTVTINSAQALDGTTLSAPFMWGFKTHDLVHVVSYLPHGEGIKPDATVRVRFDQRMNRESVAANFELWMERPVRERLLGTFRWEEEGRLMIFRPAHRLRSFADFRVFINSAARSLDGTPLAAKLEYMFQTAHFLQVVSFGPVGRNVPPDRNITFAFDRDVHRESFGHGFSVTPGVAGHIVWHSGREVSYVLDEPLAEGTGYAVRLAAAVRSTDGLTLLSPLDWEFRTAGAVVASAASSISAAQSASGTIAINFTLSAAADVQVEIMNLAGRVVAVAQSGPTPAGQNTLLWNGVSSAGTKVPAGTYLVRLNVSGSDGTKASAIAPLQLR